MRLIFVSFDEIGWYCLKEILEQKANVVGIFTLRDDLRIKMSGNKPFDDLAKKYNIPLFKVKNINDSEVLKIINELEPDISFVIGWSQLVKEDFIALAKYTCVGMHPTLLPKHRGRAPLPWAIIFGLKKTGVTMFHISLDADNGDIIDQEEIEIEFEDDAFTLYKKALDAHVRLIRKNLPLLLEKKAPRIKQDEKRASYWHKRVPMDGIIDWNTRARNLYDWIRALTKPYPGAFTYYDDKKLIIWKSILLDEVKIYPVAGKIIDIDQEGLIVSTGEGTLKLTSIEFEDINILEKDHIMKSNLFHKGGVLG